MDVNLTTYLNQLGYGLVGLNVLKALERTGHNPALWVMGQGQAPGEDRPLIEAAVARTREYDPTALSLRIAHQWDMAHRVGQGPHLGLTFFELNQLLPHEIHHLYNLDVVLVPSEWAMDILRCNGFPLPLIGHAPLGVDQTIFHPQVEGGLPAFYEKTEQRIRERQPTVFLNVGKWEVRKGHDVLVEAFSRAFTARDNVFLIMNCANPFLTHEQQAEWAALYHFCPALMDRVLVLPERLARQQDVARLMAFADCGVFPARAEGWNLDLAEMMAMGKHCIATNYSAHTEYCTSDNCRLIDVDSLEPAYDGVFFTSGQGEWAELGDRQVDQLVYHLRAVHAARQGGTLGVNQAGIDTFHRFTWDNTVARIVASL